MQKFLAERVICCKCKKVISENTSVEPGQEMVCGYCETGNRLVAIFRGVGVCKEIGYEI